MGPATSASGRPLGPAQRRIIVLRHGVTEHNRGGVWQGHLDTALSEAGLEQARAAAADLAALGVDVVVSSDLARAADTARVVAQACDLPVRLDPRLREVNVGAWQGLSAAQVEEAYPGIQAAIMAGDDLPRGVHGETLAQVAQRATAAALEVADGLDAGGVAVLVTHGVACRALVGGMLGWDQRATWLGLGGLGNCAWAELRQHAGRWRLFSWNVLSPKAPQAQDHWQSAY
ncbi:MAG: histidine phosphatase family protein [Austwickia sp.]|jgi:broad specificity phosphatase PhoE|nr:histidine phosphatase family protein [Austwickia sp.]MBK9100690.1 histidine phosphatase family protein [Austwickia sp.]